MEDKKSSTRTKPSEETDSSNDQSYSMQKLFRTKTEDEPKNLDEALLKSMQDVKSEMQNVFVRVRKWQCKSRKA